MFQQPAWYVHAACQAQAMSSLPQKDTALKHIPLGPLGALSVR